MSSFFAAPATSAAMSIEKVSACSISRSQSYTPMTVETRRSLIDTVSVTLPMLRTGPAYLWSHDRLRDAHSGRGTPAGPRGRARTAARRPVDGDQRAGLRTAPGARGAADRLGQVGGVLRRDGAAAGAGRRAHGDRLAAARADAQPGRGRGAGGHPRAHHQLGEPRGVGAGPRG